MATGVLVERLHCGPRDAARQLDALAAEAGTNPLELAAEIVDQAAQDDLSLLTRGLAAADAPAPDRNPVRSSSPTERLRTAEGGALAAADTQAVADSLLRYALAPLGATALAVRSIGADAAESGRTTGRDRSPSVPAAAGGSAERETQRPDHQDEDRHPPQHMYREADTAQNQGQQEHQQKSTHRHPPSSKQRVPASRRPMPTAFPRSRSGRG